MKINQLIESLDEFKRLRALDKLEICGPFQHCYVRDHWLNDKAIPGGANNGIYIYTDNDEKILYIGRADQEHTHGINYRACDHLRKVTKDAEYLFSNHQWVNDTDVRVTDEIKKMIKLGDFLLWTFPIEPYFYIPFFEVYFQTYCRKFDNILPPLNKRIG